jgi:hypothetical protein
VLKFSLFLYSLLLMNISEGAEGREAGVPGGGGAVEDIIGDIHKCIGEALWWLLMDYDVSIKGSDAPADCSSPRTRVPIRLSPPSFSVWFSLYCHAFLLPSVLLGYE